MHTNQRHLASYPGIPPYKSNCMKYHNINFGWQEKKTIKKFGWLIFLFNKKKTKPRQKQRRRLLKGNHMQMLYYLQQYFWVVR